MVKFISLIILRILPNR